MMMVIMLMIKKAKGKMWTLLLSNYRYHFHREDLENDVNTALLI